MNFFGNEFENQQSKDTIDFISSLVKVTMKMHQPVREDLLKYLESNLLDEEGKAV